MSDHDRLRMSGPGAALRWHLDLFRTLDRDRQVLQRQAAHGKIADVPVTFTQRARLMATMNTHDYDELKAAAWQPENVQRTLAAYDTELSLLNEAETHYVSESVMLSIESAAEVMEPEPLYATDLPSPNGLIVFEYPMLVADRRPWDDELDDRLRMPIRAIGWKNDQVSVPTPGQPVRPDDEVVGGLICFLYTEQEAWERIYLNDLRKIAGPDYVEHEYADEGRVWVSDITGWAFDRQWELDLPANVISRRRWLLAYFRWTWQRLLVATPYEPKRAELRTAERFGRPVEDGHIKIIRLRRTERGSRRNGDNDGDYKLDHRYVCRGHWRRQWYRSLGPARNADGSFNDASHRLVWIDPHIRGPEHAPLVVGHNVSTAVR